MLPAATELPRLRQAVVAAAELEPVVQRLQQELRLGEPYSDPAVGYFGLQNEVFAVGDSFLEVVSPVKDDTAAGRLMQRRGGYCGYMLMFQVDDLGAARARVRDAGVREVLEIDRDDIAEVHLHPRDMRGAIMSLSEPRPLASWPWGGEGWERRAARSPVVEPPIGTLHDRIELVAEVHRTAVSMQAFRQKRSLPFTCRSRDRKPDTCR